MRQLVLFSTIVVLVSICYCADEGDKKRLQIGIKKKVEDCTLKSKKGDYLSMYVTYFSYFNKHVLIFIF
jgi:peptidylprolyl isomerase/FK506-binding protein 2